MCKHIIGVALVWDRLRNVPDPEEVLSDNIFDEPDNPTHDHNFCQLISSAQNIIPNFTPEEQIGILKFISNFSSNVNSRDTGNENWVCPSLEIQLGKLIDVVVKRETKFTGAQHATLRGLKATLSD